jgi:hypothetical protein
MAAAFTKDNQVSLQASVGGAIGATELYLAHFLGAGGAAKFLTALRRNPGQSAAAVMPQAADANEPVFYHADGSPRSLAEVYNRFAAKFSNTATVVANASQSDAIQSSTLGFAKFSGVSGSSLAGTVTPTALGESDRASLYEMLVLSQLSETETPIPVGEGDRHSRAGVGLEAAEISPSP